MTSEEDITEFMPCLSATTGALEGLSSLFWFSIFTKFALPLTWVQPEHGQEYLPICNHLAILTKTQFDSI